MPGKILSTAKWLFSWQLVTASIAAYFFLSGLSDCMQALSQDPPYVIVVGEDLDLKTVARAEFLRYQLTTRSLLIALAGYAWFVAASSLRDKEAEHQREVATLKDHLTQIRERRKDHAGDGLSREP